MCYSRSIVSIANATRTAASTRERILATARRLYNARGLAGVTVRAVEKKANVTAPTIYWHFGSMDGLVREVVDDAFTRLLAVLSAAPQGRNPVDRLFGLARAYRDFALDHSQLYHTMFFAADPTRAVMRGTRQTVGRQTFEMLESCVAACIADGLIAKADARSTAVMIWSLVHGLVALQIADRVGLERPDFDRLFDRSLTTLVRGLRTQ
jgi:AcrR family transcriptional regulator